MYEHNIQAHLRNNRCHRKAIGFTYSTCVSVALIIQHAIHMHRIMSLVACLAIPYFPTSHKQYDFQEKSY
jgi:hypothetical protein